MNRAVLEACCPSLVTLGIAFLALALVIRLSGARFRIGRLAQLHECQHGGVQSLAFVITLPVFVMILLFIVQVSQLMIGIIVVNYAAYASARAASVWVPAWVDDQYQTLGRDDNGENELPPGIIPDTPVYLGAEDVNEIGSRKYQKIWTAAALACASVSPSRQTQDAGTGSMNASNAIAATNRMYHALDPDAASNSRIPVRLQSKLGYSFENTYVRIVFEDRNSAPNGGTRTYNPIAHPTVSYYPSEVGWQDPITVTVYHDFALLPGPGRFLSTLLVRADREADRVSPRIREEAGIHKTRLFASATMTNEGIRSVRPYVHPPVP